MVPCWRSWLIAMAVVFAVAGPASFAASASDPVTLVAESNWYPYSGEINGAPEGMAVDLVRAAYQAAGVDLRLITQPYARCLEEVEAGMQLGCFNTTREPANEARFLFHGQPLFSGRIVIVAPTDAAAQGLTPADMKGSVVAITNGYTYGEPFQSDASVQKEVVTSDLAILRVVALKRASYGAIYERVLAHLLNEHAEELAGKVKVVGLLSEPDLYVSFSKLRPDAAAAMDALDRGLAIIRANGVHEEIEQYWATRFSVAGAP